MSRQKTVVFLALILVLATVGIVGYSALNPVSIPRNTPTQVTVTIVAGAGTNPQLGFDPALIKIVIGVNNTVTWKNEDSTWHTAHSNIPEFYSGLIQPGTSFTHTFTTPGVFPYHCDPHPWMTGLIVVKSSGANGMVQPSLAFQFAVQLLTKSCY